MSSSGFCGPFSDMSEGIEAICLRIWIALVPKISEPFLVLQLEVRSIGKSGLKLAKSYSFQSPDFFKYLRKIAVSSKGFED